ncbi:CarD family transcriptional regulator [Bacillus sp. 2205SS5-2]|uniref:CarD family transcriptional regulator n=1 Tax=Bacillus sp. 2205SS5-2 TaxID=3109031 RepID=UPI0030057BA8
MEVSYLEQLFEVGSHIIYPMHGAGVIEGLEEKEIQGKIREYYVIRIPKNDMQVLIPKDKIANSNIRLVTDKLSTEDVLEIYHNGESDSSLSWKERYKINSDKVKSGKFKEGAEVVRDLLRIQKGKTLNSSEKQMLDSARKLFVGELEVSRGITEDQASQLLNQSM